MVRVRRYLVTVLAVIGLIAMVGSADAQGKGKGPVKKYKTTKKMAERVGEAHGISLVSSRSMLAQSQYLGVMYIGYSYIDEYGDEYIYWFPYEMIYDGDTGAIEYVPLD